MKAIHQLNTFQNILLNYNKEEPLHRFLATYYRQNKQMGSRDRKIASRLVYNFYRLGNILSNLTLEERLIIAEFFANQQANSFLEHFKPQWNNKIELTLKNKIEIVKEEYPNFNLTDVFPFQDHLSNEIDAEEFYLSHFIQPDLYIRIKKGKQKNIMQCLASADIKYQVIDEQAIAFPNGTKLAQIIPDKGNYEIQDISSQKTGEAFKPDKWDKWWDCCAASGGKALMLLDQQPDIKLLVSDNRESILENLKHRFALAGVSNYQLKVLDLLQNQDQTLHHYEFDGIILDAPCTGSGTWGRTPEMITHFTPHKIKSYSELQFKIASNVVKYLKVGKPLIYITCSVFKEENEEQVANLCEKLNLEIEYQLLIKGYQAKADTLFLARLIKK
ncbi:RsmB/NOP family class I SAM-dependent RNA methyltransferase [Pedobacter sp. SD-b]|uniref:RsmB/NOP family class I SAM-dependent RNA methyltransferase n=1 Tax=Pedobacter segetis TaxID=2793069 RepID=A0ABS1BFS8_9SPHI|nr:RsmB/NOP family class I SAM-dependent RNA methyltransferase [Pedobacter segetis]MBK0381706.1 RsmB/NOP family class I SAM-dependent RNA methyltransferase [Pedobacter segetis]